MGGSSGMFGTPKQKSSKAFKMTSEARLGEQEALNRQRDIANGKAPSLANMAFQQNIDNANNQAMSFAASQRGASNPALAFRQAQLMNQQNTMNAVQQGAIMAEQERRAADEFIARQAAAQRGVAMQSAIANQQSDANKAASERQMISGLGQGAAMAFASDKEAKEDIKPEDNVAKAIDEFTKSVRGYEYEYKDSNDGTGKKIGVMAQDLEKSKIGKTMVDEGPDGKKMVNTNKAIGALLAMTSELNKKIEKLEKKG